MSIDLDTVQTLITETEAVVRAQTRLRDRVQSLLLDGASAARAREGLITELDVVLQQLYGSRDRLTALVEP